MGSVTRLANGSVTRLANGAVVGVGIYNEGQLVHMSPPSATQVPRLMADLFDWLATSNIHPLIKNCIFHYEFEFIHPFNDGNGRLWQTIILTHWREQLAILKLAVKRVRQD
jgi:Fic family protein